MSAQDREEGPSSGPVETGTQTAPIIEEEPLPESPRAPTQIQDLRVTGSVLRPRANDVSYDWAAGGGCIYATSGNSFTVFNTPLF
ncbi:MAG: hypothetical protein R3248_07485, partial [Candidatus Promineifilaceae bacterium]|nr:hypothetical protein [Candidatus Promineifilaceae bacterium]